MNKYTFYDSGFMNYWYLIHGFPGNDTFYIRELNNYKGFNANMRKAFKNCWDINCDY